MSAALVLGPTLMLSLVGGIEPIAIHGGFQRAVPQHWRWSRVDLHNPTAEEQEALITLIDDSGGVTEEAVIVPGAASEVWWHYEYGGARKSLESIDVQFAGHERQWQGPASIASEMVVVVVTSDDGRFLPLFGMLSRQSGVAVQRADPASLPNHWRAWYGVSAVVLWSDELPPKKGAEGEALTRYLTQGGTVFYYGRPGSEAEPMGPVGEGKWIPIRGRKPPRLKPFSSPVLTGGVSAQSGAPTGWFAGPAPWYFLWMLVAMGLARRQPLLGMTLVALAVVAAFSWGSTSVAAKVDVRKVADASVPTRVFNVVPEADGTVPVAVPEDAVVLVSGDGGGLTVDEEGGVALQGRWGESKQLVVIGSAGNP